VVDRHALPVVSIYIKEALTIRKFTSTSKNIFLIMKCVVSLKILFVSAATCNDNTMNQDETDVDCGGSTCPACRKYLY